MDEATLVERLKRYAGVTTTAAGLLGRILGARLGVDIEHEAYAKDLADALGHLKGPLVKVAQILATVPNVLPPAYQEAFRMLQMQAPPMGWPFVKRRMVAELGSEWKQYFLSFNQVASAAASLGQVHAAQLPSGVHVACKLQYPGMLSIVEDDLKKFRFLLKTYESSMGAFDTENIFQEISARLREELDYQREAKVIAHYQRMLQTHSTIHIPTVIPELSTARLLTMTWMEGKPLTEFYNASQESRNQLARNLFYAWYEPFYTQGVLHGDPHPGNYTVTTEGHLNLLDFGCVRIFPARLVQGVIKLYQALESNSRELAVHAYETWGFQNLTNEIIDVLNLWARFLYGPLLKPGCHEIEEISSSHEGVEVAGQVHAELRRLGGIRPPAEFVFLDRAAVGLGSVFMRLRAKLDWHQMFHGLINKFDPSAFSSFEDLQNS